MANTTTNSQYELNSSSTVEIEVGNVQPGAQVNIGVYAVTNDGRSDWSVVPYLVPTDDSSGSTGVVNIQQDLRLTDGSIFATSKEDPLGKNLGQIDVMNDAVTGSGIIINKTGIAAFQSGDPTFQLDAETGQAIYQGKVQAGNVKVGPNIDPTGTKSGIYINSGNFWYDDGTFATTAENITEIVTGTKAKKPGAPTNFTATWTGQDLRLSFNFDTTYKDGTNDNTNIKQFIFTFFLAGGGYKVIPPVRPSGTIAQDYLLNYQTNLQIFANPQLSFPQIVVVAEDIYGNQGAPATINNSASYITPLPVPSISVVNSNNGYTVNFSNYPNSTTYPSFRGVIVEEYVTTSNVDPGNVTYDRRTPEGTTLNPAVIITPNTAQRWVRARYIDAISGPGNPSIAYKANPVNPTAAALDLQPPNDVTVGNVVWNGNNVEINYSLPQVDPGERFVITLTTNYAPYDNPALTGFFYKYPDQSGKVIITQDELFAQFGGYYTGYNGLFKSADQADNRTAGVSFIVPVKQSQISNLTPDLNLVNVFGVPNGYVVQPYLTSGATYMEIYESTTSTGPWTLKASTSQIYAATVTNFNTKYLRFRWSGAFGDFSQYTAAKSVNPLDPTAFSTVPPNTPSIGTLSSTVNSITIGIDTNDTVKTKGYFLKYAQSSNPTNIKTEIIPSNGAASISFVIRNLDPGTTYLVSAAGYNDSNIVGEYTANLTTATLSAVVSVPTNVAFTGASYGGVVTWSPPASPPTPIANYGVGIYTSAGVLFTEQFTQGTTLSVSGLKASTSYYAKVFTKDIYGATSTQVQSNTITLNALGGTNDGIPVASSPAPTVIPLFGALQVKWDVVPNIDLVTYEVHISTTSNFSPSSLTKSIETQGTFAVIKQLPNGTALNYDTTYYVRIVAKDFDGAALPSIQASGTPSKVDNASIAANAIAANQIQAGAVTAYQVDATNLFVGKNFTVGSGGTFAIKIDTSGNGTTTPYKLYSGGGFYNDPGTPFYLDSTGKFSLKDTLTFDGVNLAVTGEIRANSGYFNGPITVNGLNPVNAMKIGRRVDINSLFDGIALDANNYWYTNGRFRVGSSTLGFSWDGVSTFSVTGDITATQGSFKGAVTIDSVLTNAGLWVFGTGANFTSGARVVINKNGLFAYNVGSTVGQAASTSILLPSVAGANTFVTTNANIGGWTVDDSKIEKLTGSTYSGISVGSYAFYAGSSGSGGNNTAKFSVTQGGAVIARDISIYGDGTTNTVLQIGGSGNNAPFTVDAAGNMKATSANISGTITATNGSFSGNIEMKTAGSIYLGTTTGTGNTLKLTSKGFILNTAGITFSNGQAEPNLRETSIDADSGLFTTNSANIGTWSVSPTRIEKNGVILDATIPAIYTQGGPSSQYYVGITPATSTITDSVLWAGNYNYDSRNLANFRVDATGKLYATGASISGELVISSGATLTAINDASSAASTAQSTANTAQSTANTAQSTANTAKTTADTAKSTADAAKTKADSAVLVGSNAVVNASNQLTTINSSGIKITTSGFALNGAGTATSADNSSLILNSNGILATDSNGVQQFVISNTGSATFRGILQVGSGNGQVTISSSGISVGSGKFNIDSSGNATFSGSITGSSGTFGGTVEVGTGNGKITINSNGISVGSGKFSINSSGDVTLSGSITASGGSIGGWLIGTSTISSGGTTLSSTGKITIGLTGDDALQLNAGSNISMFAATASKSSIYFYRTGFSGNNWDSQFSQTVGGNIAFQGNNFAGEQPYVMFINTYNYSGADIRSYLNSSTTETMRVTRINQNASANTTDLNTTTQMLQFYKGYPNNTPQTSWTTTAVGGISARNATTLPTFFTGSDERLKKNIELYSVDQFIDDIKNINVYKFHDKMLPDNARKTIGFLAKEFYPYYSDDIITGTPNAVNEDGEPEYMTIMRENLIPHMFATIKYLVNKVEELEGKINEL